MNGANHRIVCRRLGLFGRVKKVVTRAICALARRRARVALRAGPTTEPLTKYRDRADHEREVRESAERSHGAAAAAAALDRHLDLLPAQLIDLEDVADARRTEHAPILDDGDGVVAARARR